jgi:hypothetical protein
VSPDAVLLAVVDRAQVEDVLLVAPGARDLLELLVVEGELVGGQLIVGA